MYIKKLERCEEKLRQNRSYVPDGQFDEVSAELHRMVKESLEKTIEIDDDSKIDAINRRDTLF